MGSDTPTGDTTPFDHWMWIELLAFDNESPDFGVQAFLDKTGFVPDVLLLFLYSADFIHTHQGMEEEWVFPPHYCSYCGRPSNKERSIQPWTNLQLRGLIAELHRHGIGAYASVMTLFMSYQQGDHERGDWAKEHPELMETRKNGEKLGSLNPLHRFPDGSPYEDFFCRILVQLLDDYGFDGFHAADGYGSPRMPLWETDYSDDIVEQFCQATGVVLPDPWSSPCDGDAAALEARAAWLWGNHRLAWIRYHADRWGSFCAKVVAALHAHGKRIAINNAWTKDPFQALYRFGVDYAKLAASGADAFIAETVGAGVSLGADGSVARDPYYEFQTMLLLMKAYTPEVPIHCLNGTRDTFEQWDVLTHGRPTLEREILSLSSLGLLVKGEGQRRPCCAGPVYCLSTDVWADEWNWLRHTWELGFGARPEREWGATVVWSDQAFARQLPDFIETRRPSTHELVQRLLAVGAPLHTAVRIEDLEAAQGALLVVNPQLFPEEELQALQSYTRGPVIFIGGPCPALADPQIRFVDPASPAEMICSIHGASPVVEQPQSEDEPAQPVDLETIVEPMSYPQPLYFRPLSSAFLKACAAVIGECAGAVRVTSIGDVARVYALQTGVDRLRIYAHNDGYQYVHAHIDVGRKVECVKTLTDFPFMPVVPQDSQFVVRVPAHGMVVFDVELSHC